MKISRITNYNFTNNNNKGQKSSKATEPSFKGYFEEMSQHEGFGNNPLKIDGRIFSYEYTRKPVKFEYIRYAYIADPGEKDEDIPQSAIDLTLCTVHTEMPFSWIRDNYRNGYKNFANNAYREKNFYGDKIEKENEKLDEIYKNKEKFKNIHEKYKSKTNSDFEEKVRAKIPGRLKAFDGLADEQKAKIEDVKNKKEIAEKRFELLCELDKIGGEKQDMIDEQARIHIRKTDLEKILPGKHGLEYETLSAERQLLENHLTRMDKAFAKIDKRLDAAFEQVEDFYKEYYPDLYEQ